MRFQPIFSVLTLVLTLTALPGHTQVQPSLTREFNTTDQAYLNALRQNLNTLNPETQAFVKEYLTENSHLEVKSAQTHCTWLNSGLSLQQISQVYTQQLQQAPDTIRNPLSGLIQLRSQFAPSFYCGGTTSASASLSTPPQSSSSGGCQMQLADGRVLNLAHLCQGRSFVPINRTPASTPTSGYSGSGYSSSGYSGSSSSGYSGSSGSGSSSGNCDSPEQLDASGRRCGNRAANKKPGGR